MKKIIFLFLLIGTLLQGQVDIYQLKAARDSFTGVALDSMVPMSYKKYEGKLRYVNINDILGTGPVLHKYARHWQDLDLGTFK